MYTNCVECSMPLNLNGADHVVFLGDGDVVCRDCVYNCAVELEFNSENCVLIVQHTWGDEYYYEVLSPIVNHWLEEFDLTTDKVEVRDYEARYTLCPNKVVMAKLKGISIHEGLLNEIDSLIEDYV